MFSAVNTAATFVMSMAAAYFFLAVGMGARVLRRQKVAPGFQASVGYGHPFVALDGARPQGDRRHLYFLIPCLNEQAVIGQTVSALVAPPGWESRIVVVDDGSDDATAQRALQAGGRQVQIVTRRLPDARHGKGAALNAGFTAILADVTERGLEHDRVIVVVMDADGHLSDGAVHEVLPLFDDPVVGGVQLAVRIRNRNENFLLQFQDHQFWTLSSFTQFGRVATGTVSLGGNGQFARLSALLEIGEQPWSSSLTEDLDLSISLAVAGWRLTTTPRAAVDQQGVGSLRPLIRQRTRWYQGHMMSGRRLPQVMRSSKMGNAAAIEMVLYLLVPWLFDLPWSVLYHVILVELGMGVGHLGLFSGTPIQQVLEIGLWYLLGFWPALITAVMARRRDPAMGWLRALKLGHCFVATNYLSYVCAWSALARIVRKQNGWVKTVRVHEGVPERAGITPLAVRTPSRVLVRSRPILLAHPISLARPVSQTPAAITRVAQYGIAQRHRTSSREVDRRGPARGHLSGCSIALRSVTSSAQSRAPPS